MSLLAHAGGAGAQESLPVDAPAGPVDQSERAGQAPAVDPATIIDVQEIVVTARYGAALVEPETELSEQDIAFYGANSIADLIQKLKPVIDGSGEDPVLLVNGKRVGTTAGLSGFPPEALLRLGILPPEAAARYGYPSGKRVVNLVLKNRFRSWTVDAGAGLATAGGNDNQQVSVGRMAIDGPTQWSVQVQMSRDSGLRKSDRRIPRAVAAIDLFGHVENPQGGEIDPALSLLAGQAVTVAGIPPAAPFGMPGLADFAESAGTVRLGDPNAYDSLLPSGRMISFNAGVTHPLGSFSGSININASRNDSKRLNGIPTASVILPGGSPWSPFADDVTLVRSFAGDRPLRNDQASRSAGLSMMIAGAIGDWQTSLSANYTRSWSNSLLETAIDQAAFQGLIDAPGAGFNPYGPLEQGLLLTQRNRSKGENLNAQLNVSKPIVTLPAGPVIANFSASVNRSSAQGEQIGDTTGETLKSAARQSRVDIQQTLSIPIASRSADVLAALGDLSADLSGGIDLGSDSKPQRRFDGGLNWSPFPFLRLRGLFSYGEQVPSVTLLEGARIEFVTRVYDFVRQEIAEPVRVVGGNPDLQKGSRYGVSLNAMLRPFASQFLTLNMGYQRRVADGGVGALPAFTPVVEAAFPERIIRDAAGRLVLIDARPINIERDLTEQLNSSLVLTLPAGSRKARASTPGVPPTAMADPLQLSLSVNHSWQLKSELLVRRGIPVFDRLGGDGGEARHNISVQLIAGMRGMGATLSGNWEGPARIRNIGVPDGRGDYRYLGTTRFNLALFMEPEQFIGRIQPGSLLSKLRVSLDIDNLSSSYRRVVLSDGSIPEGYSRDEIDPLGRTVRLTINKRF